MRWRQAGTLTWVAGQRGRRYEWGVPGVVESYVIVAVATFVGTIIGLALIQRGAERRRSRNAAGGLVRLPVKIRIMDASGYARRWREGWILVSEGSITFAPRKPRPGRRLDLSGIRATGRRGSRTAEKWWFDGPVVLTAEAHLGALEIGFGDDRDREQAEQLLGG